MKLNRFFFGLCCNTTIEDDIVIIDIREDYTNKYMEDYNKIKDLPLNEQDEHGSTYFIVDKNTIMKYCINTQSFIYYTNTQCSYEYLQSLARNYVIKFNCPRFYSLIGLVKEDTKEEEEEEDEVIEEDDEVFVKARNKRKGINKPISLKNIPHRLSFICKGKTYEFNIRNPRDNTLSYESFLKLK